MPFIGISIRKHGCMAALLLTLVGLSAACGGRGAGVPAGYPSVGLVAAGPGLWVVGPLDDPSAFYANESYWYSDGGAWYRRPELNAAWQRVDVGSVPPRVALRDRELRARHTDAADRVEQHDPVIDPGTHHEGSPRGELGGAGRATGATHGVAGHSGRAR